MSVELANETYLDGDERGLLGQFASNKGFTDLIHAASEYEALSNFLEKGVTENVDEVRVDLEKLIEEAPEDVASTAKALLDLSEGQKFLLVTNGGA